MFSQTRIWKPYLVYLTTLSPSAYVTSIAASDAEIV